MANERDELGDDLVPDYLTSVHQGAFYGWPYSYYGQHVDKRVEPPRPDLVSKALPPDYALGAHVAALGLVYSGDNALPDHLENGMFIGEHGSWNREVPAGYKVVFVPFAGGKPNGMPVDVLTGFVSSKGEAWGRPVGVTLDQRGALLVADDVGNTIWRAAVPGKETREKVATTLSGLALSTPDGQAAGLQQVGQRLRLEIAPLDTEAGMLGAHHARAQLDLRRQHFRAGQDFNAHGGEGGQLGRALDHRAAHADVAHAAGLAAALGQRQPDREVHLDARSPAPLGSGLCVHDGMFVQYWRCAIRTDT